MPTHAAYQRYKYLSAASRKLTPTTPDIEGPFYRAGAPILADDGRLCDDAGLLITGRIMDADGHPVADAVLDFWQADTAGNYDQDGFTFRGKVFAAVDERGAFYRLRTVRPGDYKIADDPPDFRCAHIHVKVSADGFKSLTTQLYFPDDQYNATDHWFSKDRVIQMKRPGEWCFDFVLERAGG